MPAEGSTNWDDPLVAAIYDVSDRLDQEIEDRQAATAAPGASQVIIWRYGGGTWPALPATKPAGVMLVRAIGPTPPTTIPSYLGQASNQILLSFSKLALT